MELLVDSARQEGITVLLVTHEARVAAYADRECHSPRRIGELAPGRPCRIMIRSHHDPSRIMIRVAS